MRKYQRPRAWHVLNEAIISAVFSVFEFSGKIKIAIAS